MSNLPIKILFACLCILAVGTGVWGFLSGGDAVPALVASVVMLVAAQLLVFVLISDRPKDNTRTLETISKRLGGLEKQIKRLRKSPEHSLQKEPAKLSATKKPEITQKPGPAEPAKISPPNTGPAYLDDRRLSLYLEPVVEISTKTTMFYRAELAFSSERLGRIRLAEMNEQVVKDGCSAAVDMKLFNLLGPVIDRLAQKGRVAGIVCPMSLHSFSNQAFLEDLTRYLKEYRELARVLVIEISQENLAGLSQEGMAGLAFLAQIGATFCLGGAGVESPDLDSLASLGFRYLDLDYNENINRYGLSAFGVNGPAADLTVAAAKVNIELIGSGFIRQSQCDALNHIIKFGRGAVFSAPRLVRADFAADMTRYQAA